LWRSLPREARLEASQAFWEEPPQEALGGALAAIIKARHLRPQVARSLPQAAKSEALATVLDPGEPIAAALIVGLHLRKRRDLLVAFLDATKIPHENGLIQDDLAGGPVAIETLREGLTALRDFAPSQVAVYLNVLWLQDPERWSLLPEVASDL
jgi:hypothetical protein